MATSATGGYLSPSVTPVPTEDAALEDLLQAAVSALSGIKGSLVRPRWQPEPAVLPDPYQTWAAIGITGREHDVFAYEDHVADGDGYNRMARTEEFTLLCSFYGPAGDAATSLVRDGFSIAQNREALQAVGIVLISAGNRTAAPEYINAKWYERTDMPIYFRRLVVRHYPILSLLTAQIGVQADIGISASVDVENP
jgi:hypothetical protein